MRQGCEIIVTKEVSPLKDPNPRIIKLRNLIFLDSANVSASKILVADTIVQTFQNSDAAAVATERVAHCVVS